MTKFNQVKYQNNYINEKYDRVNLTVPKGMKDEIKRRASEVGESMNEYINNAIKMRGEREMTSEKLQLSLGIGKINIQMNTTQKYHECYHKECFLEEVWQ